MMAQQGQPVGCAQQIKGVGDSHSSPHGNMKMKHSSDSSDADGFPYDAVDRQLLLSGQGSSDISSGSPSGGMVADNTSNEAD